MSPHHGLSVEEFFSGIQTSIPQVFKVKTEVDKCKYPIRIERISDFDHNTQYRCVRSSLFSLRTWLWDKTKVSIKVRFLGLRSVSTDLLDDQLMEELCQNPIVFQNVVKTISFHPDRQYPQLSHRRQELETYTPKTITVIFFLRRRVSKTIQIGLQLKASDTVLLESVSELVDQDEALSVMSESLLEKVGAELEAFAQKGVKEPITN